MTRERWLEVRDLFDRGLALPRVERESWLERLDPAVRREVTRLYAAHERAEREEFLAPTPLRAAWQGRRLGPYRIVEEIGRGGTGTVYRAERVDEQFDKQVAIKVLREGTDVASIRARFLAERQILAALEHPFIARLLDGGTTEEGLPYIVMELVEGQPLTEFADAHDLEIEARLRLFRDVCAAVHHAHQSLVIHRDLKPSNILVTAAGTPKLLDFGIATLLTPGDDARTLTRNPPLTPAYASPEQRRGASLTTASDVYSLGVVLFELLAGMRPGEGFAETSSSAARTLDSGIERPSAALARREASCEESPEGWALRQRLRKRRRLVQGDLDTVTSMALREEPARRYRSADQLAADVERFLAARPVLAQPDTFGYRLRRFSQRNPAAAATTLLLGLALIAGVASTTWQARVASIERARAEQRLQELRQLSKSLLFELHDAIKDLPGATVARRLVVDRARQYLDGLGEAADPDLQQELAIAYRKLGDIEGNSQDFNLGRSEAAQASYAKAVRLQEGVLAARPKDGEARRQLALTDAALSTVLRERGAVAEAQRHEARALAIRTALVAEHPENIELERDLAMSYESSGFAQGQDAAKALEQHRRARAIFEEIAAARPDDRDAARRLASAHKHVGGNLISLKRLAEALAEYQAAQQAEERLVAANPDDARTRFDLSFTYSDIGFILGANDDIPGALASYQKALAIREALAAKDPSDTRAREGVARTYGYLGSLELKRGRLTRAAAFQEKSLAIAREFSEADPGNLRRRFARAQAEHQLGLAHLALAEAAASDPRASAAWRRAQALLERARDGFLAAETAGLVHGGDVGTADAIAGQLRRCAAEIARQGAITPSPQQ